MSALALCLSAVACSGKSPSVDPTATSTARGTASPSPTGPSKPTSPVARLAVYAQGGRLWLYDAAKNTLRDLARGKGLRMAKFVNANEISFLQGTEPAVLRIIDIKTGAVRDVFTESEGIDVYGWSPDRAILAYISTDRHSYPHLQYRYIGSDVPVQSVATLARAFGRGGIATDQMKIQFSPDGDDILIVYTPADGSASEDFSPEQSQLQVRSFDGELAFAADMEDGPTMATWSVDGTRVFFRIDQGARAWRADTGVVEGVRGGVRWFNPWPSPDGKLLAYDTGSDSTAVRTGVIDLDKGSRRTVSGGGRYHPVFARANLLWVQRVRACTACLGATEAAPEVFSLNITTGAEKKLALRSLAEIDVWYR